MTPPSSITRSTNTDWLLLLSSSTSSNRRCSSGGPERHSASREIQAAPMMPLVHDQICRVWKIYITRVTRVGLRVSGECGMFSRASVH